MTDLQQLEQRLRRDLVAAVRDEPAPLLPTGADYRAAARRRLPALPAVAVAAAVLLIVGLVTGVVVSRVGGPSGVPAAGGGPAAWPARGSLAGDVTLTHAAARAWEAALLPPRELPHHDVAVLYAEHTIAGDVVVLTGVDALGQRRIAEFDTDATSTTVFRHRLHLVADLLAPTGDGAGLIAINAPRHTPGKSDDDLLVVLAAPGTQRLQWRDEATHWADVPAVNGAGALVHPRDSSTSVRAGHDGDGVETLGRFYPIGPPDGLPIVHDLDRSEKPPTSSTASCSGNVCSVSAGGSISVQAPNGGWRNVLDSGADTPHDWWEFGGEVQLYTDIFRPNEATMSGPTWTGILPGSTAMYLEFIKGADHPMRLIAYVDRPEWAGGSVIDIAPAGGQLDALAIEVPTPRGRTLDVVVIDGLIPQWKVAGGQWQSMAPKNNVATTLLPAHGTVSWRAIDPSGNVVTSGKPHVIAPR
jgi:hypothetical protein